MKTKMFYPIVGMAISGIVVFCLVNSANESTAINRESSEMQDTAKSVTLQPKKNNFEKLREIAMSATPEQLGLVIPGNMTIVYGVIMDWEMEDATATTVSYETGDASLYLSTGGAVIGGGQHPNVKKAAKQFVRLAQTFLDKTVKTEKTPLPVKDEVKFYLLTNKGIYLGKDVKKNFENNSSIWVTLFGEGNKVLAELRKTVEMQK